MDNKEFYVEVSFSGKLKMVVSADNLENAKQEVFNTVVADFSSSENITIDETEWDLINKAPQGNIKTPYIDDFYIEESE